MERLNDARILIYSHDSFGLGHLRRCRAIAHALVDRFKGVSVLILSGSPIIGSFDFRSRVDFVRIPGVIKLSDGEYQSLGLHIALDQTMEMRAAIIRQTALSFRPDLFLVDKEPLGLKGEVVPTLQMLKAQGTTLVLGLRDIMDEPKLLLKEWKRKQVLPALEHLYDEIWVYGLEDFADPLAGVACPLPVRNKILYTGYLRRAVPQLTEATAVPLGEQPYVLVTVGGGDDGMSVVDWVLRAYERDPGDTVGRGAGARPLHAAGHAAPVPRAREARAAHRRGDVRRARRALDGTRASASWRWPDTTRSAKFFRWTSGRSWCRGPSRARNSCCARCGRPSWDSCARSIRAARTMRT